MPDRREQKAEVLPPRPQAEATGAAAREQRRSKSRSRAVVTRRKVLSDWESVGSSLKDFIAARDEEAYQDVLAVRDELAEHESAAERSMEELRSELEDAELHRWRADSRGEKLEQELEAELRLRLSLEDELLERSEDARRLEESTEQFKAMAEEKTRAMIEEGRSCRAAEESYARAESLVSEGEEALAAERLVREQTEEARRSAVAEEQAALELEEAMLGRDAVLELKELARAVRQAELSADEARARGEQEAEAARRTEAALQSREEEIGELKEAGEAAYQLGRQLRSEADEYQEEAASARAACERADSELTEEAAAAVEALEEARAWSEMGRREQQSSRAAREEAEAAEERCADAQEGLCEACRERDASREELKQALSEARSFKDALSVSEESFYSEERGLRNARQEWSEARGEVSAYESQVRDVQAQLSRQTALCAEAEADRERFREAELAAERRAEASELGRRAQEWQERSRAWEAEARAGLAEAAELRDELDFGRAEARALRAELSAEESNRRKMNREMDNIAGSLFRMRQLQSRGEDSVSAEGDAPSVDSADWTVEPPPEQPSKLVTTHTLPQGTVVLLHTGEEKPVGQLRKGMWLKSVNEAREDDGIAVDKVRVASTPRKRSVSEAGLQKLVMQEDAIELLPEQLVLAKRDGARAWHRTEMQEFGDDDQFTLLVSDGAADGELASQPLEKAEARSAAESLKRPTDVVYDIDIEDLEGVIFVSTHGGRFVAVCGLHAWDHEVVIVGVSRNPEAYHHAIRQQPTLYACRMALEKQGHSPYHPDPGGATVFLPPSLVSNVLKAIDSENEKLGRHHIIVTLRLLPYVKEAIGTLPSSQRVVLKKDEKEVRWSRYVEETTQLAAKLPPGLAVKNTFLELVPSESGSHQQTAVTVSSNDRRPEHRNPRRLPFKLL